MDGRPWCLDAREALRSESYNFKPKSSERESMGKLRRLFEFSEESRIQGYSEGSEGSICTSDLPAQTKAKIRRESIWDRCPRAHRAQYLAGGDSGAREER